MSAFMITDAHADFLATAYRQLVDMRAEPQHTGAALLEQNARSLRALYADRHGVAAEGEEQARAYFYRRWTGNFTLANVNKQAACALYQACETADFDATPVSAILKALIAATGGEDCKWDDADPWGIDHHPTFAPSQLERWADDLAAPIIAWTGKGTLREIVALRLASPKRADPGKPILAQHDAGDLDLFRHSAEPGFAFEF